LRVSDDPGMLGRKKSKFPICSIRFVNSNPSFDSSKFP
jgi:hypothetical protein